MGQINKVAVLGAGVMGSTIAAHFANAGLDVLLLDIVPKEPTDDEKKKGLGLESPAVRNRFALKGLEGAKKAKPAPFYLPAYASHIETGNLEDDLARLKECDWVIEVVLENMDVKKKLFSEKIAPNLKEGAILSTNTSGLSVNEMAESLPPNVRKNFLVTHFFNPPRYMRLLEIVPCKDTSQETVAAMAHFISNRLGKGIVYAKDTPNFVGNRIGVYAIFNSIRHMLEMKMTVEEVDAIAGPATGRPKSAAFRTVDLVGIDTLVHIAENTYKALPNDEQRDIFKVPEFMLKMVKEGLHGSKTEKGFYKKEKGANGSNILYYDYTSSDFKPLQKPKFGSIQSAKMMDNTAVRVKAVVSGPDKASEFAWKNLRDTIIYAFNRVPEIADDVVNIDNAMKWGFNWELGPFEMLDAIGINYFVERAGKDGVAVPEKLKGIESFYRYTDGRKEYFDITSGKFKEVPQRANEINLEIIKKAGGVVEKNANCSIVDLGDGVFCFEFHSKMNSLSNDILSFTHKAVKRAETEGVGLVIGNRGANFSAGANLMMLAVAIAEGAFEDVDITIRAFQKATMGVKYAKVPVVAAPFHLALGGGCEFPLHADAINAYAETYMGLVEIGVGLLPAGGGTKEMAVRAIDLADKFGTDPTTFIFKYFKNIGLATVSMSASELFELGYMREGDSITMNFDNLISDAKQKVIALAGNYRPKKPREDLKAPGRSIAASMKSQLWNMKMGGFATEYEAEIGGMIADVITGGDVPAGTIITEKYLLDLEREKFLKLCGNKKTIERIQHMLKKGKPLRN
ncbi:MAG: 3-hydroxyacyl-CoA dehydrogenase NAD-binding domain-containing protein [Nitrospinota bacterium]|nr:3-hydroxyacyl-CoA dehydrogenase NAD-binding domain-containing protein [Nitrospinota bacterium]